jgi:small conductance mechanosensitive channel
MDERLKPYIDVAVQHGVNIGTKIVGAILLWIIGRLIIRAVLGMMERSSGLKKLDVTIAHYLVSASSVLFNLLLLLSILSLFGVETTTFAGILAAAGVAIGMAWSGLLSNLAAGVFMVVLRPFKVGDFVTIGGMTGTVQSIGVELTAQLAHGADHQAVIQLLKEKLAAIPNVAKTPAPDVEILDFNLAGPVLAVRPYCHTDHYWDVYFATTKILREELGKLALPVPAHHYQIHQTPSA